MMIILMGQIMNQKNGIRIQEASPTPLDLPPKKRLGIPLRQITTCLPQIWFQAQN